MELIKQVLVLRKDLNMRKGKMVAQGAHASQLAIMAAQNGSELGHPEWVNWYNLWMRGSFTKICLGIIGEDALRMVANSAKDRNLPHSLVIDNGATEFHGIPTPTAVGIGPAPSSFIDGITGVLQLL